MLEQKEKVKRIELMESGREKSYFLKNFISVISVFKDQWKKLSKNVIPHKEIFS